jgi:DNA-binding GntR family transcriptional regulator
MAAAPTLSQTIAQSIAEEIVSGQLPPGRKLDELRLAQRFNVSRTPIRDALRHLVTTRLIEHMPRNGFSVTTINETLLGDLFEAASEIEALSAGLCALRAGAISRTRVAQIHEQGQAAAKKNSKTYATLNEELHSAIYAGSGSKTIESIAIDLRNRLAPFRLQQFYSAGRMKNSAREHEEIVSAIMAFDKAGAESAMRRHILGSAANVLRYFKK